MKTFPAKIAFVFAICFLSITSSRAQVIKPGVTLGVNGVYSMPRGWFKDAFKFGLGGEVYGGVGWGKTFLIATLGYRAFRQDVSLNAETLTYLPVKVGIKQMFLMKRIFIQGDIGAATVKYRGTSASGFTAGAGAGVRLAGLELGLYFDKVNIKYFGNYGNSLNAKVGYSFSL